MWTRPFALAMVLGFLDAEATFAAPQTQSQAPAKAGEAPRLRVFLDCECFPDYLRDEISWVDFVRQPQDADVHILSSTRETGGGGTELVLRFVGRGRFADVSQELRVMSQTAEPENLRRAQVLRTTIVGLLGYVAREGLPTGLELDVDSQAGPAAAAATRDPWDFWLFSIGTSGSLDAEETQREIEWDVSATADRVTEDWTVGFGASIDEERETFDLDEDEPIKARRTERNVNWFVGRALGPHWSVGFDGRVASSTFANTGFLMRTAPAVEFNVFPYREYATRQFVFQYELGFEHARYNEVTIYDRLRETHPWHSVSATLDQRQPWGSLQVGVEWSQYLHDVSKYRVQLDSEVSLRIVRGFSVTLEAFASRQRDQLSLPRRGATPEEVLLRLRELESGYEARLEFGITYSFGSLFNNVVNPRFATRRTSQN